MRVLFCSQIFLLLAGLFFAGCTPTTLRKPLCAQSVARIPKELEGTYRLTLNIPRDSGLDLAGISRAESYLFRLSSDDSAVQVVSLAANDAPLPKLFTPDSSFCYFSGSGYYQQSLRRDSHTWEVSKVTVQDNGFSIAPLGFHPDRLTERNIRFLLVEDLDGFSSSDQAEGNSQEYTMIIDNTRKTTGEPVTSEELLLLAQPTSMMLSFVRIPETEKIRSLMQRRGKTYRLSAKTPSRQR